MIWAHLSVKFIIISLVIYYIISSDSVNYNNGIILKLCLLALAIAVHRTVSTEDSPEMNGFPVPVEMLAEVEVYAAATLDSVRRAEVELLLLLQSRDPGGGAGLILRLHQRRCRLPRGGAAGDTEEQRPHW